MLCLSYSAWAEKGNLGSRGAHINPWGPGAAWALGDFLQLAQHLPILDQVGKLGLQVLWLWPLSSKPFSPQLLLLGEAGRREPRSVERRSLCLAATGVQRLTVGNMTCDQERKAHLSYSQHPSPTCPPTWPLSEPFAMGKHFPKAGSARTDRLPGQVTDYLETKGR